MYVNNALNGWLLMVLRPTGEVTVLCIAEFMFVCINDEAIQKEKKRGGDVRECVLRHAFYEVLQQLVSYEVGVDVLGQYT